MIYDLDAERALLNLLLWFIGAVFAIGIIAVIWGILSGRKD